MNRNKDMAKEFAVSLNGEVWTLLGKQSRSSAEDQRMIHAAHASLYHWLEVGGPVQEQRGEWLVSHVYASLGIGSAALRHAQRCAALTKEHGALLKDFDHAYGALGLARAFAVLGENDQARKLKSTARSLGDRIADPEDKKIFDGDFNGGDWGGVE